MITYTHPLYTDFKFSEIVEVIPKWTWQELNTGLTYQIIQRYDLVKYANNILEESIAGFETVLELAITEKTDFIEPLIDRLILLEKKQEDQDIMDKWRFAMLLHLYLNREKYSNVYEQVACISADFNHPKDMNGFIYYMPSDGVDINISWIKYLKEQSRRFNVDIPLDNKL